MDAIINLLNILQFKTPAMRKFIVVTGGSQGIGRAILLKFVSEGFDAVTCARNEEDLAKLKKETEEEYPDARVFYRTADMAVKTDVLSFAKFIESLNRPVNVLVNNAGYFMPGEIISESDGNLESMVEANLYSAYHMTRALIASMIRQRSGHIFNMCSIASIQAYKNGGSYAISKFALLGFSKCLREEVKEHNLRVTAILPGATKTRSWEPAGLPDDRFVLPEDVANTVFSAWSLSASAVVEEVILRPLPGDI